MFLDIFRRISKYGFLGNFSTWEDAVNASTGHNSDEIIRKVKESLLKVKSVEAVHERDSVLYLETF